MTDRIALTDLADPQFDPAVREILDLVASTASAVSLEPADLMAAAVDEVGLDDFGDSSFQEPFGVLCSALREEAGLSDLGKVMTATQLAGLLKNRLRIERYLADHPDALDLDISRPIVIAGLPRTGTTHLHNLLSADPALRHLPYWESLEPLPLPGEASIEPRRERAGLGVDFINAAMPHFAAMHEMTIDHAHEEIQLLAMTFSTMFFETLAPIPSYRDWWDSHDQRPAYAYLKRVLQVLQHARGGDRWVLKSPQHLAQLPALLDTFPDATVVVTHRDPVAVTISMATMVAYTARLQVDAVDPVAIGSYWSGRVEQLLTACSRDRDVVPGAQSLDVRFDGFMAAEWATVGAIYNLADQTLSPSSRQAMEEFLATHPRGRHGAVDYRPEPLGIDPAERRQALQEYADRFGV
ncbi:MAG: sulfotransferase [Frankiaceae bacterium]|nr:sulfotransferase [Frankiaceae bacterium]MBV9871884.1 sulfotransferase [Frankiaceae bacterium]